VKTFFNRRSAVGAPPNARRLFFATDIHGSDRCFRKFINAGRFYGVDYLIMGGDITGKSLVLIEQTARGWSAQFNDHQYVDIDDEARIALEQNIRDHGQYPYVGDRGELEALADEGYRDVAFRAAVVDGIRRWVQLAEERLAGTGIRCFITPGNDDYFDIDEPLQESNVVEFVDGSTIRLDEHEMLTCGYSNITPWGSPRELPEEQILKRLNDMASGVEVRENLIVVIHPPPFDTPLDHAPAIDGEFVVQMQSGAPKLIPVGSTAVRDFVEAQQPLLGLHGHVHESKASDYIGRTLCINPGSEYTEGTLAGAIVTLGDHRVLAHQLIVG
jgi:Icc-related predicted phosphoesterase